MCANHWVRLFVLIGAFDVLAGSSLNATNVTIGLVVPLHGPAGEVLVSVFSQYLAAALMAVSHVNNRHSALVPEAQQLLPPGFQLSIDVKDSLWSASASVGHAIEFNAEGKDLIVGSYRSAVSGPLSLAAAVMHTPVIAWASTSSALSDKSVYHVLSRTAPSDKVLAVNMLEIIKTFGWAEVGVLAVNDAYGSAFVEELLLSAPSLGLSIISQQKFLPGNTEDVGRAVAATAASGARILICVMFNSDGPLLIPAAATAGILGEGFVWLLSNEPDPEPTLAASGNRSLTASLMQGCFTFGLDAAAGGRGARLAEELAATAPEELRHPIEGYDASPEALWSTPCDAYCTFLYDAVWAGAVAGSRTRVGPGGAAEKEELLERIRGVEFEGASGRVQLDTETGDRRPEGIPVVVRNWQLEGEGALKSVVAWEWREGRLTREAEQAPVWPGGRRGWRMPPLEIACAPGTVLSEALLRCVECGGRTEERGGVCEPYNVSAGVLLHFSGHDFHARWVGAAMMAMRHVNSRSDALVPGAKAIPEGFRMTVEARDSGSEPTQAIAHALHWTRGGVDVVVGAGTSFVTGPVALAASIDGTPVVTYAATSSSLSDRSVYPGLSRTVPSDALLAEKVLRVAAAFNWTRVGVIYLDDAFGRGFANDLGLSAGRQTGVEIGASQKYILEEESVDAAMAELKASGVRVVVSIALDDDTEYLVEAAEKHGLLGPGYVWLKPDGFTPEVYVSAAADKARAVEQLTGWFMLDMTGLTGAAEERFLEVFRAHPLHELQHPGIPLSEEARSGRCDAFCAYLYDAVWLAAIAASKTTPNAEGLLQRETMLHNIRTTPFEGSSGLVELDPVTGDRSADDMTMVLRNLQPGRGPGGEPQIERRTVWVWGEATGLERVVADAEPPFWHSRNRSWTAPSDGASCVPGAVFSDATLSCTSCPAGTHQQGARCLPCAPGSVAPSPGATKCFPCTEGVAALPGQTACEPCPANSARPPSSLGVDRAECRCLPGFFALASGVPCDKCPAGAVCDGGSTPPYPRKGFWGDAQCQQHGGDVACPHWPMFVACNPDGVCEGGPEFRCMQGQTGPRCNVVEPGWSVIGGVLWFECGWYGWLYTVFGISAVVFVWFIINKLASSEFVALNVGLLFIQITALISSFGLKWHPNLQGLNVFFQIANFDMDFFPPNCISDWGPVSSFYFQLLLPLLFGMCYACYFSVVATLQSWRSAPAAVSEGHGFIRRRMWRGTVRNTVSICCIVYTTLALKCFSVFRCVTYPDGHLYMALAPQVRCWEGKHLGMAVVSGLYIPVVLLGLPVLIFMVLRHKQRKRSLHSAEAVWQWAFVHSAYEADYKWWECVLIFRRLLIALITVVVDEPMLQAAATMAVLAGFLAAHSYTRPYILASADALDFAGLCGSILYVLGGLLFYPSVTQRAQGYVCDYGAEESGEDGLCAKEQDVKDGVSALCMAAVGATLLIATWITLASIREHRASRQAMKCIDSAFQRTSSAKELMATVNKVRLDEIIEGSKLLRWVHTASFDQNATSAASAFLRTDAEIGRLGVDLTDFSSAPVAATMRHICEIDGLVDYLVSPGVQVQPLLEAVEHLAAFIERRDAADAASVRASTPSATPGQQQQQQQQPRPRVELTPTARGGGGARQGGGARWPLTAMTKFEFRPLLCYWLLVAGDDARCRAAEVLEGILRANGIDAGEGDAGVAAAPSSAGRSDSLSGGKQAASSERHAGTTVGPFAAVADVGFAGHSTGAATSSSGLHVHSLPTGSAGDAPTPLTRSMSFPV